MSPQRQWIKHNPEEGAFGDCHRTAVAMILDMSALEVEHFCGEPEGVGKPWTEREKAWLAKRGLTSASLPFTGETTLEYILEQLRLTAFDSPCILGGLSGNGVNHSVVVFRGEIHNPGDKDLIGPCDDGYWWITFLAVGPDWNARTEPKS